jgi:Arc/MetJ-type ribon-helix-helix transcriptional regulator
MKTINISLPDELKKEADNAIADGHYASFSDLTRTALRQILRDRRLDRLVAEAKKEYKEGKGVVLRTDEDIDKFMEQFKPKTKK